MMGHGKRSSSVLQLATAMVAFAMCAALLESGGLYDWAVRLELGPLRTVALPVATKLHTVVERTGFEAVRAKSITALARAGWSDDPAAAEGATTAADTTAAAGASTVTMAVPPPGKPGVVPESKLATPVAPVAPAAVVPLAGEPPLTSALPPLTARVENRPLVVALAGDSMMAVGLAETLNRQAAKYPGLKFVKAYKSGTGLARPEVFNWQREYPAMLGTTHPDVVLVAIGANDGQGFVDNGVTYPFGSDGWKTVYQQRLAAYLAMVAGGPAGLGTQVIWLSLPPMKSESYGAKIALVNRVAYTVVGMNPQASWYSTAALIGNADGSFRDFGAVGGKQTRLRAADGIHMSVEGATLITDKLLAWLAPPPAQNVPAGQLAPVAPAGGRP